jgi:hypothetical protein
MLPAMTPRLRDWVVDCAAFAVWSAVLLLLAFEVITPVGFVTFALIFGGSALLGFVSGRFRMLLAPLALAVVLIVVASFASDDCDPARGCEDDENGWALFFYLVFFAGLLVETSIGVGLLFRRLSDRLLR